jgi:ribonuclease BN (tRNA processing enzyme)
MGAPIPAPALLAALAAALTFVAIGPAAGAPADLDAERAPARTEILFLGTAGGPPLRLERSEPSTLLIVDGRAYLIDCGIGTIRRLLQAGVKSEQIRTIFFTHLHADHALGLADVLANDFFVQTLSGRAEPINIYGPPQTKELVDAAFRFITVGFRPLENVPRSASGAFTSPFTAHEFSRDGVIFQDDRIRVTAAENSHYALMPKTWRAQLKSYSYRIETPHGVVVFTGDTGPSDAVTGLAQGADVLVAEANTRDREAIDQTVASMSRRNHWPYARTKAFRAHFEMEHLETGEIGRLAAKAKVKAVVLYHYVPENKADQAAYVTGVQKWFSNPVYAPDDLERYCLEAAGLRRCGK